MAKISPKETLKTFIVNQKNNNLFSFANQISKILQVECPTIHFVDCIFDFDGKICYQDPLDVEGLPSNAFYVAGYLSDTSDLFVAHKNPIYTTYTSRKRPDHFEENTFLEKQYVLAHELRHHWQKTYQKERYYQYNARGNETIHDVAEVDADAFALLVIFSDMVNVKLTDPNQLPHYIKMIFYCAFIDNGKRWDRTKELAKDYTWAQLDRIEAIKAKVSISKIKADLGF
jgi:hypothetical protein